MPQIVEELERAIRRLQTDIAQLQERSDEHPVRYPRPTGGSGFLQYGVIRGWSSDTRPNVDVTILEASSTTGTITGITQATNAVVTTSAAHALVTGDSISFSGVAGMTQINGLASLITVSSTTTFSCDTIDSTGFTAYTSGGTWTLAAVKKWVLPNDTARETVTTEPGTTALDYEAFKFVGTGSESFPLTLPDGVVALPIISASGQKTILHHSKIYYGTVPAGMPITDGIIVNGQGEVGFAN